MYSSKVWLICFFCVSLGINISASFQPSSCFDEYAAEGRGRKAVKRWSFDPKSKKCNQFTFRGRHKSMNNFEDEETCKKECLSDMSEPAYLMNVTMSSENPVNMPDIPVQKGLRSRDNCHINNYDRRQYCLCGEGRKIYYFYSWHSNRHEDRQFDFRCTGISGASSSGWNLGYSGWNNWDATFYWDGTGSNSYMVGMESYHDNGKEDRRFNLMYRSSNSWKLSACTGWIFLNVYDQPTRLDAGEQVIGAFYSHHHNGHEDRDFAVRLCALVRK